jgi:hypothetical protein
LAQGLSQAVDHPANFFGLAKKMIGHIGSQVSDPFCDFDMRLQFGHGTVSDGQVMKGLLSVLTSLTLSDVGRD